MRSGKAPPPPSAVPLPCKCRGGYVTGPSRPAVGRPPAEEADRPGNDSAGLEPADVWNRLENLAGDGWFVVQRAGEVVKITWRYGSVEEVVDALAG